mmetsp:Transcript_105384/g.187388  ORF Transcript_105384/g.187388 Transcript_105384/m.187388 type:complete len:206 (+) Transcript_105384:1808-2425(+)
MRKLSRRFFQSSHSQLWVAAESVSSPSSRSPSPGKEMNSQRASPPRQQATPPRLDQAPVLAPLAQTTAPPEAVRMAQETSRTVTQAMAPPVTTLSQKLRAARGAQLTPTAVTRILNQAIMLRLQSRKLMAKHGNGVVKVLLAIVETGVLLNVPTEKTADVFQSEVRWNECSVTTRNQCSGSSAPEDPGRECLQRVRQSNSLDKDG